MAEVKIHDGVTAETPTQSIVRAASQPAVVTDAKGRKLGLKRLNPLDRLKLFEVIGPDNSKNEAYVGYAALAFLVSSIDGDAVPRPGNKIQLEALVQRLDDDGMDAIATHLASQASEQTAEDDNLKNVSSTPS